MPLLTDRQSHVCWIRLSVSAFLIIATLIAAPVVRGTAVAATSAPAKPDYALYTFPESQLPELHTITTLYQDRRGLIWVGGGPDLVRYDGNDFRRYGAADGISSSHIYSLLESPSGVLHACTWRGLRRYHPEVDRWTTMPVRSEEPVRSAAFFDGGVFVGLDQGLSFVRGNAEYPIPLYLDDGTTPYLDLVNQLSFDSARACLWVGTQSAGLYRLDLKTLRTYWAMKSSRLQAEYERQGREEFQSLHPGLLDRPSTWIAGENAARDSLVRAAQIHYANDINGKRFNVIDLLSLAPDGELWIEARNDLAHTWGGVPEPMNGLLKMMGGSLIRCEILRDNVRMLSSGNGLWIIEGDDTLRISRESGLDIRYVTAFLHDKEGLLWLGGAAGDLQKMVSRALRIEPNTHLNFEGSGIVELPDSSGGLYLVTTEGVVYYRDNGYELLPFKPKRNDEVRGGIIESKGRLLVATRKSIYLVDRNGGHLLKTGLPAYDAPVPFARAHDGTIWFLMGNGIWSFRGSHPVHHLDLNRWVKGINALYCSPDGSLFMGSWNGLYRLRDRELWKITRHGIEYAPNIGADSLIYRSVKAFDPERIPDDAVFAGGMGPDSAYWFGTYSGGVLRLKGDSLTAVGPNGSGSNGQYVAMNRAPGGDLYFFGSHRILVVGKEGVRRLVVPELSDASLRSIKFGSHGRIYIGTSTGLAILEHDSLRCIINHAMGLPSNRVYLSGLTTDGTVLFTTSRAICKLEPERFFNKFQHSMPPMILDVRVDGKRLPLDNPLVVPPGNSTLRIDVALPSYINQFANRFSWKLEGLEDRFTPPRPIHHAEYQRLRPGRYTFRLRAFDALDNPSRLAVPMTLVIKPFFYQTAGFRVLMALLVLGLVYAGGAWRIHRVRLANVRLEQRIAERTRELKAALEELERSRNTELEAARLRTAQRLAAAVAHEFNNPMSVLLGAVDLLERSGIDFDETRQQELFDKIPRNVEKMSALVKKLRNVTSVHETDYVEGVRMIDLNKLDQQTQVDSPPGDSDESQSGSKGLTDR